MQNNQLFKHHDELHSHGHIEDLPEFLQKIMEFQSHFNHLVSQYINQFNQDPSLAVISTILVFSFIYGALHALTPGHGKAVVLSYFMSNESKLSKGVLIGSVIGTVHILSAIVYVSIFAMFFKISGFAVMKNTVYLELTSYLLITFVGAYMIYRVFAKKGCCHNHEHDNHKDPKPKKKFSIKQDLLFSYAIGLQPCIGAVVVLLFTLGAKLYWVGLLSVISMGVGVAISVLMWGVAGIATRKMLDKAIACHSAKAKKAQNIVMFTGAVIVLLSGAIMSFGAAVKMGY
ncbi:hypothetical protein N9W34_04245 [Rickettsiales bacterium]|nr:hypothetical protein [Rickettsiales bacterium]